MKFKVTMKDPDTLHNAIREAVQNEIEKIPGIYESERDMVMESRQVMLKEITRKWFKYGEYLTVEIDTEAMTCIVMGETPTEE